MKKPSPSIRMPRPRTTIWRRFPWEPGISPGAEKEFRAALAIDPGVAEWRTNLAMILAMQGELAEARYQFDRSIRLDPAFIPARLNYARVLANANDMDGAERQAKEALNLDPKLGPAHELLGSVLSAKGDIAGAIRELNAALSINPDSGRTHYELGVALSQSGRFRWRDCAVPHCCARCRPEHQGRRERDAPQDRSALKALASGAVSGESSSHSAAKPGIRVERCLKF